MTRRPEQGDPATRAAPGGRPRWRWIEWSLRAALVLLILGVFGQTLRFGSIRLDDPGYVFENPHVLGGPAPANLDWAFTTLHRSNWHPLTWISLQVDAALGGGSPAAFHATNLLLHTANTLLLFQLLTALAGAAWRSAAVAALFAIHPLHVESVVWITERKDVLSTLFFLLCLLAYVRWARSGGAVPYVASLVAMAASLLAKPMAVTIPPILALLEVWPPAGVRSTGARRRAIAAWIPFAMLATGSAVVTWIAQSRGGALGSFEAFPAAARLSNAAVSCVRYLLKAAWPSGLALPYPYDLAALTPARVTAAVAALAAITWLCVRARRARPQLLFGWGWYLATLLPVLGIVQVGTQAMADRYTYIPFIGVFIAVVWSCPDLRTWPRSAAVAGASTAAAGVLALAVVAWNQTLLWRSSVDLFSHSARVAPGNAVALDVLGLEAYEAGRTDDAIRWYRQALAASARFADAHSHLATALVRSGRLGEALEHYAEAVRLRPADPDAHANLGILLDQLGRSAAAEERFRQALRIDPASALARSGLGLLLARGGRDAEALPLLEGVVRDDGSDVPARINVAAVLSRLGRLDEARVQLEAALRLDPRNVLVNVNLGALAAEQGRTSEAEARFTEALRRDPDNAAARAYLERLRTR